VTGHEKILAKMRASRSGWRPDDFRALYVGFGFVHDAGSKHDKYRHPRFPQLWTTVTRSQPMSRAYADDAIDLIDDLRRLENENGSDR
jgi:hypothetical protein